MLLCQWGVSSNREGLHRPLIVAQILEWRQHDFVKVLSPPCMCVALHLYVTDFQGTTVCNNGNQGDESCCPEMEISFHETNDYPFHDVLVKYLDTRAPLPSNL